MTKYIVVSIIFVLFLWLHHVILFFYTAYYGVLRKFSKDHHVVYISRHSSIRNARFP